MRPTTSRPQFLPILRYRDVVAAVDWLCEAFGFNKCDVITAVDGTIVEARLMFGDDMILLLPARRPGPGKSRKHTGAEMQSCYLVVDDVDRHYRHAKAAGAEILDITDYDYGGRGYSCRDPEGHIWDFGTYDPWQTQPAVDRQPSYRRTAVSRLGRRTVGGLKSLGDNINPRVVFTAVVAAVIAVAVTGWVLVTLAPRTPNAPEGEPFKTNASLQQTEGAAERIAPLAADRAAPTSQPVRLSPPPGRN